MAPTSNAVSPLLPRSPSNMNITSPPKAKSLAVRKSISKHDPNKVPETTEKPPADFDMAEQMNEEISNKYVKGKKLGEGQYAVVYQGHLRADPSHIVAIKKFKVDPNNQGQGLNFDTIREIKYLQELSHSSIVALLDIFSTKDQTIHAVIEYFPHGDLETLAMDKRVSYSAADIKAWMGMMCRAIYFCHSHFVLHRDIKPNNLLIAADGEVKLADFGLARSFTEPHTPMTSNVITIWYRPPELFFGARHYGGAVDMWSIGMVFAFLIVRRAWCATDAPFAGWYETNEGHIAQIEQICNAVGTPNEGNWPGVSKLPHWFEPTNQVPVRDKTFYTQQFPTIGSSGVDLIMSMLKLDPRQRVGARGALEYEWWSLDPRPTEKEKLPKRGGGATAMGRAEARAPGVVDEGKFKGVARKLDFGAQS